MHTRERTEDHDSATKRFTESGSHHVLVGGRPCGASKCSRGSGVCLAQICNLNGHRRRHHHRGARGSLAADAGLDSRQPVRRLRLVMAPRGKQGRDSLSCLSSHSPSAEKTRRN